MKTALIVPRLTTDPGANLATIERMATEAHAAHAQLILFPEAALTGLINNDDPAHDLPLGQPVPGQATDRLGALCAAHGVWLGFGLLERDGTRLYDSAVLLSPAGTVALKYRRVQPQWHGRRADPAVYSQGRRIPCCTTPVGTVAFLICGDLFDDTVVSGFRDLNADWMLFPMARCFADGTADQVRWDTEELPAYARRVSRAATPALMVNYLAAADLPDGHSFGGACVIAATGEVLASYPLGQEGMLLVELDTAGYRGPAG